MADSTPVRLTPDTDEPNTIAPIVSGSLLVGAPVRPSTNPGHPVVGARGDSLADARVIGLLLGPGNNGERQLVRTQGSVQLATSEWDAVAGTSGGLTPGAAYFLSAATAGRLTATAPVATGNVAIQVGVAINATTMIVQIMPAPVAHA